MTSKFSVGLIAAGRLTDSGLARSWRLRDRLGPVKSPTLRVASRIANTLRAGHPVADYREFGNCSLIFISVPQDLTEEIIDELSAQDLSWDTKAIILYSQSLGSSKLKVFASAGASVGTVADIPGFEERWFLLESEKALEVRLRQVLDPRKTRVTLIRPGLKPMYLAALACPGWLFQPMLIAANEALSKAGIPVSQAATILEKQVERAMRSYFKAGRKALPAENGFHGLVEAVEEHDERLARYLKDSSNAAQEILARGAGIGPSY